MNHPYDRQHCDGGSSLERKPQLCPRRQEESLKIPERHLRPILHMHLTSTPTKSRQCRRQLTRTRRIQRHKLSDEFLTRVYTMTTFTLSANGFMKTRTNRIRYQYTARSLQCEKRHHHPGLLTHILVRTIESR